MSYKVLFYSVLRSKTVFIIFLILFGLGYLNQFNTNNYVRFNRQRRETYLLEHEQIVERFYAKRKSWNTSNLGGILFQNKSFPQLNEEQKNRTFVILIYKRWDFLKRRHLYYFGSTRHDPLEGCSARNCIFVGNNSDLDIADAVIVHLHTGNIPIVPKRNREQRWIFLNDEAPKHAFSLAKNKVKLSDIYDIFNWSMSYRTDSDVPVPYGRTVALNSPRLTNLDNSIKDLIPNWNIKIRNPLVAILISNCGVPYRKKIMKELTEMLPVHVHGGCGDKEFKNSCPGHFKADCNALNKYLFYLALENSKCKEYITEKIFYHAYLRGAIPIIQGPTKEDCNTLLPPNSYLHIDSYKNIGDLAEDIQNISEDEDRLLSYHRWRNNFKVLNEHGFFGSKSYHLCRVCEAMNYNDKRESVYREDDINGHLNTSALCRS